MILILKQLPHLLGHDDSFEGEIAYEQADHENTFSEIGKLFTGEVHYGAIVVGVLGILILILWDRWKVLKNSIVPGALVVVLVGVLMNVFVLGRFGEERLIQNPVHLVDVPRANGIWDVITLPDFSRWNDGDVYFAAVTIAIVAALETLLNLEAVDKLDPQQRDSPSSRELIAQGCGNLVAGMIGGLPITSVIIRGSVNVTAGAKTKFAAIFHGLLLVVSVCCCRPI